jgi:tryptophanyl-tRNA synthetase
MSATERPKVLLTGIKPTGDPHIGNLLGAIQPALQMVEPNTRSLYFIADYHALTGTHDRAELQAMTLEVAATWLAFGLDPANTVFYRQSDVPEIFELAWVLSCFCPKGWMNKAHAYKAQVQANLDQGIDDHDAGIGMGLYTYPVLMAADILMFDSDLVPVGKDQVQHVEIARDIAQRINSNYRAEVLRLPRALVRENTAVVPGIDGRKMSKSYGNTLPLFLTSKKLKKTIGRIVTDSTPPEAPKDPATSTVFQIYKAIATPDEVAALSAEYARGISWGAAKMELYRVMESIVAEPRERYTELMAQPERIEAQLVEGAARARALARPVLERVRDAVGITR